MTVQTPGPQAPPLLDRLRAELAEDRDKSQQALLLHECGALSEQAGDEPGAARDYLAAFSADPHFREPLEALVRILTRRKSVKNLGKLLEALVRAASSLEERVRAYWERAAFLQDYEQNLEAARESLEEAVAANPEDATVWLELEILAGKEGNAELRLRALEARAELATDSVWKALLLVDLALLTAKSGATARAYELLDAAAALEGRVRYRTQSALETVARAEDNVEVLARALESQADLLAESLEDPARADENGVPRWLRKAEHVADLWYRSAELRRRVGDEAGWATLVQRAADTLPGAPALARARIAALEASGDLEGAAKAARREVELGADGAGAAALWLRVAEAAAVAADRAGALEALGHALEADPGSVPARALQVDLLGDGEDPKALAKSYEALAETFTAQTAKAGALVVAAYLYTCEAAEVPLAKAALAKAIELGFGRPLAARCARVFAALAGDPGWYEEATRDLLEVETQTSERVGLLLELGRSRLLHVDLDGARATFDVLAKEEGGEWIGRALAAYGPDIAQAGEPVEEGAEEAPPQRSADALEALARVESDAQLSRGLLTVAAFRAARAGNGDRARALLAELLEASAADEVAAGFLSALEQGRDQPGAAAAALSACAAGLEEAEVAAALHLEAALLFNRAGDRAKTVEALEAARGGAPRAAATLLAWALRASGKDLPSRRRALEAAAEAGEDPTLVALERFGLEVAGGGEEDEALSALEAVEQGGLGDVLVAGALARLVWPRASQDAEAVDATLSRLAVLGGQGAAVAASERFYRAAAAGVDRMETLANAAARAEVVPELAPALEWLGAALGADDRTAESTARRLLATQLDGEVGTAVEASAELVDFLESPVTPRDLLQGEGWSAHYLNLELGPPGCDPRRRSAALRAFAGGAGEADVDALILAGWADLAAGQAEQAAEAFRAATDARGDDLAAWEGMRASAGMLGDHVGSAVACAQLGALCKDDARGAAFWEQAGLLLLEHTEAHDDAEIAFERAFGRDPTRGVAFDKLFRRVRGRNEDDKLLEIISRRLEVVDDETELCKLWWERARVLRKKGDLDGAMEALENVVLLENDHVGAIALTGEIHIIRKRFDEAAPSLARLAGLPSAPQQQRLVSGVAAADLYENKLGKSKEALEVLLVLHDGGLSTPPVRERLARIAAKTGAWADATRVLEQLMNERDKKEGRVEAARLAMAIHRDELRDPIQAEAAVARLLDEVPDDAEAVELVLTTGFDAGFRAKQLGRAKQTLIQHLAQNPLDADRVAMLAKIAGAGGDAALRQATLGALVTLGRDDGALNDELAKIDRSVPSRPQIVLDGAAMAQVADPDDHGLVAELFAQMAEIVSLAIGPTVAMLGVGKKERVDSRGGHPLRVAIAEWMGALAFETDFELYVGGPDPKKVTGVAGELPAIVVGAGVQTPLDVESRSAIAREVFALRRGISAVRTRDDATVASLVAAACQDAGAPVPNPPFAVFGEVSRSVKKEMTRKVRNSIRDLAARIAAEQPDARAWASAARRSLDRMAVIAAGDASVVVAEILGVPRAELASRVEGDDRVRDLLRFVLSPNYLEIRRKLGMGVR